MREHNWPDKHEGKVVRIISRLLPTQVLWLSLIEPHRMHGKRPVVAPGRLATAQELADRVCSCLQYACDVHLALSEKVT